MSHKPDEITVAGVVYSSLASFMSEAKCSRATLYRRYLSKNLIQTHSFCGGTYVRKDEIPQAIERGSKK